MKRPQFGEKREPRSVLPPELFDDSELLSPEFVQDNPPRRIVDYRQPVARKKLVRYLADEFQRSEVKLAYTDNWSHNTSWENFPPAWKDTATYLRELTDELHARDIAHICNVAISIGAAAIPQSDIDLLAASTDGKRSQRNIGSWIIRSLSPIRGAGHHIC